MPEPIRTPLDDTTLVESPLESWRVSAERELDARRTAGEAHPITLGVQRRVPLAADLLGSVAQRVLRTHRPGGSIR